MIDSGKKLLSKLLYIYTTDGMIWFRLFGWGLCFKDLSKHPPLFSERNGYTKRILINNWSITKLKQK